MAKPARPGLKFSSLNELLSDVEQLGAGSYQQAGKWDLGMIVDHLTKTMNSPFVPAGMRTPPWPIGGVMRFFYCQFARRDFYPAVKIPAPEFLKPTKRGDFEELVQVVEKVEEFAGERIACPPFGELPIGDFRAMQLLHGAHHLSFLKVG